MAPGDDAQRGGHLAALRALHRLARVLAGISTLPSALLVDARVTPAGATEMGFGAASGNVNGVPPSGDEGVFLLTVRTESSIRCHSADRMARSGRCRGTDGAEECDGARDAVRYPDAGRCGAAGDRSAGGAGEADGDVPPAPFQEFR